MTTQARHLSVGLSLPGHVLDRLMPMHVMLDTDGCIRHMGPTMAKMSGRRDVIGLSLFELFEFRQPTHVADFESLMKQAGKRISVALTSAPQLPLRAALMRLPDQAGAIMDLSLGLSFARAVTDFSLTLHDFSPCDQTIELLYLHEANSSTARLSRHLSERLQAAHATAEQQARTDVLTGLPNRRAMDDELHRALNLAPQDFSVLHLDLDLFKDVNDTYGHAAGDVVLTEVGRILQRELRRNDFPARVGGDEFLILLRPVMEAATAGRIARRLIESIERPIRWEDQRFHVSASIGIAATSQYPKRPSVDVLMADVDAALYRAKREGRGRFAVHNPLGL